MDPRLLGAIIGILFLGLGSLTIVLATKRQRHARALGQPITWYKDLTLLTGLEYALLGIIVFLNMAKSWVPAQFQSPFAFFFTSILIVTALLLLLVVFRLMKQPRQAPQAASIVEADTDTQSPEERAAETQRKRERRQKAAAARRRRAGRA
jgi:cytochrome bd-type quinol oxidase subunit 2